MTHHYPLRADKPVLLENIHISDVYASKSRTECNENMRGVVKKGALIWFEKGIICRNVTVENVYRNERNPDTQAPTIRISEDVIAQNLQIRNVHNTFIGEELEAIDNRSPSVEWCD